MSGGIIPPSGGSLGSSSFNQPSSGGDVTQAEFDALEARVTSNEEELAAYEGNNNISGYLSTSPPPGYTTAFDAVYQFDNTANDLKDRTANGRDLELVSSPEVRTYLGECALNSWRSYPNVYKRTSATHAALATYGEATMEIQASLYGPHASNIHTLCGLAGNLASDVEAENALMSIRIDQSPGELRCFWESGAGVNRTLQWAWCMTRARPQYVALVRAADGLTYDMYLDGYHIGQKTGAAVPTGGGNCRLWVGGWADSTVPHADIYSFRYSRGAMTAAQIASVNESIRAL